MKNLKKIFWFLLFVFLLFFIKSIFFSKKPLKVEVYRVKKGEIEEIVTNTKAGTVKAKKRAKISPRTSGQVLAIPKKKGDFVKKGDLILKIEDSVQRANIKAIEKQKEALEKKLKEIEVSLELAVKEEKRSLKLYEDKIISEEFYDKIKTEKEKLLAMLNSTKALINQAEAELNVAKEQLKLTETYAPFDGFISEIYVEEGEWVSPSLPGMLFPPALEIIDLSNLYVCAQIDEMDYNKTSIGNEVRVSIDSVPYKHFKGKISKISLYVQDKMEQNRTVEVEIEVDLEGEKVLPGTSADIEIIVNKKENVLIIPTPAIFSENKVFLIENGRVYLKEISFGIQNWAYTEVIKGLKEGDLLVSSPENYNLKEGMKVLPSKND